MRSCNACAEPNKSRCLCIAFFYSRHASDQSQACGDAVGLPLSLCQPQCFPAGVASLFYRFQKQGRLRLREQCIQQVNMISAFAQQLASFFAQSHCLPSVPLCEGNKCQGCQGNPCSLLLSNAAIETESSLAERHTLLILALQTHCQAQVDLSFRLCRSIFQLLQQRNLLYEQRACAIICSLVARKFCCPKQRPRLQPRL